MKRIVIALVALLLTTTIAACSSAKEIILYDYITAVVPESVYKVNETDVDTAIGFLLIEKEVLIDKTDNCGLIEDGDIAEVTATKDESNATLILYIGSGIEPELEAAVLGKAAGCEYPIADSLRWSSVRINRVMQYSDELTEVIARDYFDGKSVSEIRKETEKDIAVHRYYEYILNEITDQSTIKGYDREMNEYVNRVTRNLTRLLDQNGECLSEYVGEEYELSVWGFKEALRENYRTYLILHKVMEDESLTASHEEYAACLREYANAWGLDVEEAEELYGPEYIYLQVYLDMLFDIIQQSSDLK